MAEVGVKTNSGLGHVTVVSKFAWKKRCGACGTVCWGLGKHQGGVTQCSACAGYFSRHPVDWRAARMIYMLSDTRFMADQRLRDIRKPLFFNHKALKGEKEEP